MYLTSKISTTEHAGEMTISSSTLGNVVVFCGRILLFLLSIPTRMRISLGVVWLKEMCARAPYKKTSKISYFSTKNIKKC